MVFPIWFRSCEFILRVSNLSQTAFSRCYVHWLISLPANSSDLVGHSHSDTFPLTPLESIQLTVIRRNRSAYVFIPNVVDVSIYLDWTHQGAHNTTRIPEEPDNLTLVQHLCNLIRAFNLSSRGAIVPLRLRCALDWQDSGHSPRTPLHISLLIILNRVPFLLSLSQACPCLKVVATTFSHAWKYMALPFPTPESIWRYLC